ncbi:hypothetical protein M8R19_27410 [Pseudomonas sp. R3.Fl]|uniref:hypothetical protein n=1 Tax=Pseudomonas TaxID=286 RepID=UPI00201DB159|nr:hypothetical protein [Pseudomonas sp. R3.Fl]MCL6692418.1 hypothetical protein [Pseudomonas sp. R3.Fl]
MKTDSREASTLIYKSLGANNSPRNDAEYRELLAKYRADREFSETVKGMAEGLELKILDVSERGMVIAPFGKESRFSIRLADLRRNMTEEQKVAMVLTHLAIGAAFYPTTDFLDDESRTPWPVTMGQIRDSLSTIAHGLQRAAEGDSYQAEQLRPGWSLLVDLPPTIPGAERASLNSLEGMVKVCLTRMQDYGLVRKEGKEDINETTTFTPTHQFRVQLRELTLPRLFQAAIDAATPMEG